MAVTTTPVVNCRGLEQAYGPIGARSTVLAAIDLSVSPGEIIGISGPSGSGKSTLLRLLAAIEPPNQGQLFMGGQPVWHRRPFGWRSSLPRPGYVMPIFQDPVGSLDPRWPIWRSISEPLLAPHHRRRLSKAAQREFASQSLARVHLSHVDPDARPSELSVGQCQRVAILRAITAQPAFLAADEPTSCLDVTSAAGILGLLREVADSGTAIALVSHDVNMLRVLSDRVLRVDHGHMTAEA